MSVLPQSQKAILIPSHEETAARPATEKPMNLQVLSCNYQTADLSIRERLAFSSEAQLSRAYQALREQFPTAESVVISTCNRVELYLAHPEDDHSSTSGEMLRFLSKFHNVPESDMVGHLLAHSGPEAVKHLFEVTSSLDSMVLGEPQIVNQVKEAYRLAELNQCCGPLTHLLFQGAIRVSSRVRTETKLSEGRVSIASVAVGEFAKSIFDRFHDKTVLIIGAGEMAEETLRYLKSEGVQNIVVINRSPERAQQLASLWGGAPCRWEDLEHWLAEADVIVSTTGATQPIVDVPRYKAIRKQVRKPVFILDLGAPRDFAPGVGNVDENVFLYDIDDLESTCERNRKARVKEVDKARRIIREETEKFMAELNHRATGPIIKQLRDEWHQVKVEELRRLYGKLPHLADPDREQIEQTFDRMINKLLHPPLEVLKQESRQGTHHGLLDALKRLFHLEEQDG